MMRKRVCEFYQKWREELFLIGFAIACVGMAWLILEVMFRAVGYV